MVRRITRFLWFTGWSGCAHRFPASGRGHPLLGVRGRSAPGDKNYNLPGKNVAIYLCNGAAAPLVLLLLDRKSTRLNSSHTVISYAVFCLKKKKKIQKNIYNNRDNENT